MDACLLDVLHDGCDVGVFPVAERVDVELERLLEKPVEQDPADGVLHRPPHFLRPVADPHGTPAEHVRGPDEHGVADPLCCGNCLVRLGCGAPVRATDLEAVE